MKIPVLIAILISLITSGTFAADKSVDELRKEFEAYKAASEARINRLETRERPSSDIEKKEIFSGFEFHGYFRAGLGVNSDGDSIEAFKAPNAGAKYRLGNEAETYIETTFRKSFLSRKLMQDNVDFFTVLTFAYVTPTANNNSFDSTLSIREAYAAARSVWKTQDEALFWAGNRYYEHIDIHMNDFFFRDMAGFGGGIEDIKLGNMKFAVAWLGGSIDELSSDGTAYKNDYHFNKNTIDLRLYDIKTAIGTLAINADIAYFEGDTLSLSSDSADDISIDSASGWALGAILTTKPTDNCQQRFSAQYGDGAADNFKTVMTAPQGISIPTSGGLRIDPGEASRLRLTDDIVIETGSPISLQAVAVYEHYDNGLDKQNTIDWFSIGARPVYHFNDYFSLAFEGGVDHTDQKDGPDGTLTKLTIAPQIQPGRGFFDRPSIRLFATYAFWSGDDDFESQVAPAAYADDTDGFSFGVQMEAWW